MNPYNRRFNNKRFSNNKFVGNQSVNVPDAEMPQELSNDQLSSYTSRNKAKFDKSVNTNTAFQKFRSYDLTLDKAEVKIAGAAPIFGPLNPLKSWSLGPDSKGTFTAALNQQYMNNEFFTLYLISRLSYFNYQGVDYLNGANQGTIPLSSVKDSLAMRVQREGAAMMQFELEAARTYDMVIADVIPDPDIPTDQMSFFNLSPTMMTLLMQYQHELLLYVLYIATFDRIRAVLPLLQSLDFQNQAHYARMSDQLKRSRYTAAIKSIKSTLKRRWIDVNFIKTIIMPFMILSKKTDGLNSPILELIPVLATPVCKFALSSGSGAPKYMIPTWGITEASDNNKIVSRQINFFGLEDVVNAIVVPESQEAKRQAVEAWLDTQFKDLEVIVAQLTDWTSNPLVIAVEAMLSKISTRPGAIGMNWQQNISPNEVSTFSKFDDWEVVNSLVLNVNTKPKLDSNGFTINLPVYQYDGFDSKMIQEYFQYFYLESNLDTIGFVRVSSRINNIFRDGHKTVITINQTETETTLEVTDSDGQRINETPAYASRVFQESYPMLTYHRSDSDTSQIINPQLMTYLPVKMENKAGDAIVYLKQQYIIPMA